MKPWYIFGYSFFAYLFLLIPSSPAFALDCLGEKQAFINEMLDEHLGDEIEFNLPPDDIHDVIKAMPTKKIGEWLELRFKQGSLDEIRFVTPLNTKAHRFNDACVHTTTVAERTKLSTSGFTDDNLNELLNKNPQGVLYTLSPSHPLSQEALPSIIKYAQKYQMAVTLLTDPTISKDELAWLKSKYPSIQTMESIELIYRGMFNHFPSTIVYKDKKILGRPMLGARGPDGINQAFQNLLLESSPKTPRSQLQSIHATPSFGTMKGADPQYRIKRSFHFPKEMQVRFVRAIPNSEKLLVFEANSTARMVHVYDTINERIEKTFNHMSSPYMSADGKFAVFVDDNRHLVFQLIDHDEPFFIDTMSAWYPGLSVVVGEDGKTTYRLITRMMDLKIQDYSINFDDGDKPSVTHVSDEHRICTNFPANATPYISRFNGDMFTLIQPDNSRQIVKLLPDNTCEPLVNLGFWTWKAIFNFDNTKISFTAVRVNSMLMGPVETFGALFSGHSFIYDIPSKQLAEIPGTKPGVFSYPEFRQDGTILLVRSDYGIVYEHIE